MAKLPQVSGNDLIKAFKKDGWVEVGQKGSQTKLTKSLKPVGKATIIIPQHPVIKKGTLSRILKDSGMTVDKLRLLV